MIRTPNVMHPLNVQKSMRSPTIIGGQGSSSTQIRPQKPDAVVFSGNTQKENAQKEVKSPWYKKPATKIVGGGLLLAGGIGLKMLGIATVIGLPVLVPIAIGMAGVGLVLTGWGLIQALKKKDKTSAVSDADKSISPITYKMLLEEIVQTVSDDSPEAREVSRETLKKFGVTEKELDDLRLQLEAQKVQTNSKSALQTEIVQRLLKSKSTDEIFEAWVNFKNEKFSRMFSVI